MTTYVNNVPKTLRKEYLKYKMHSYRDIMPLRMAMLKFKGPPIPKRDKYKRILETYWLTKETCKFWLVR